MAILVYLVLVGGNHKQEATTSEIPSVHTSATGRRHAGLWEKTVSQEDSCAKIATVANKAHAELHMG